MIEEEPLGSAAEFGLWRASKRVGSVRLIALLLGLSLAPVAQAELVWDRSNMVGDRGSLSAVVADPMDPQVVWVASQNRVWVSDDGGNAWYLVAQILGNKRAPDEATSVRRRVEDPDDESDDGDEPEDFDEETSAPIADDEEVSTRNERVETLLSSDSPLAPVIRLRLIDDQVFFTGDRGLWAIDRAARTLGTAVEIRMGRSVAVRDVIQAPWGPALIATSKGLRQIDPSGMVSAGRGRLGERDILCLTRRGQQVLVATKNDGLWRLDDRGAGRLGIVGIQRPRDVITLPKGDILIANTTDVLRADPDKGQVLERWPLRGVKRLAQTRSGRLWAVGSQGAWSWTEPESGSVDAGQWTRQTEGIGDRRLSAVASVTRGDIHLWVVGRGGAWRLIPERLWVATRRERASDHEVAEGAPPVWELIDSAKRAHRVTRDDVERMRHSGLWAFSLPTLEAEYQYRIRREEDRLNLPELDRELTTLVQVYPNGHHVQVMAMWDLFPVVWALFDADNPYAGPTVAEETVRALASRNQIRSAIVGLYNLWSQRRDAWRTGQPPSAQAALKAILSLQHIEADLHVLSHQGFSPMTTLETVLEGGTP